MILPIGKLDRRITIQSLTQTQGQFGELIDTWTDVATVWANVYFGGGREFEQARQINAEIEVQFQVRYRAGISTTMRISYGEKTYDIVRVDEVGRRERLNVWGKARQS